VGKVTELALATPAEPSESKSIDLKRKRDASNSSKAFQLTTESGVVWVSQDGAHWQTHRLNTNSLKIVCKKFRLAHSPSMKAKRDVQAFASQGEMLYALPIHCVCLDCIVSIGSMRRGATILREPRSMSAVYAHQSLSLAIPYEAARSGDAELKVEVLSPEDNVLDTRREPCMWSRRRSMERCHIAQGPCG